MTPAPAIAEEGLTGKRALVSGGTRGLGAAITARLQGAGAHVTTTARPEELGGEDREGP